MTAFTSRSLTGRSSTGRPVTGRLVLGAILAFFAVVLAVNGVFVFLALDTWTGTTSRHAYVEGLAHNERLAAARRQAALGWRLDVETVAPSGASSAGAHAGGEAAPVPVTLHARLRDAAGTGIDDARLVGELRHSMAEALDTPLSFTGLGDGLYAVTVALPRRGRWELRLEAETAGGTRFRRDAGIDFR